VDRLLDRRLAAVGRNLGELRAATLGHEGVALARPSPVVGPESRFPPNSRRSDLGPGHETRGDGVVQGQVVGGLPPQVGNVGAVRGAAEVQLRRATVHALVERLLEVLRGYVALAAELLNVVPPRPGLGEDLAVDADGGRDETGHIEAVRPAAARQVAARG
jgi:hypothetical protein